MGCTDITQREYLQGVGGCLCSVEPELTCHLFCISLLFLPRCLGPRLPATVLQPHPRGPRRLRAILRTLCDPDGGSGWMEGGGCVCVWDKECERKQVGGRKDVRQRGEERQERERGN